MAPRAAAPVVVHPVPVVVHPAAAVVPGTAAVVVPGTAAVVVHPARRPRSAVPAPRLCAPGAATPIRTARRP
ncbi:hypothetical protein ACX80I_14560, partial [Arthrobacter sp. MDT3-44]